eukprot:TRINITY_DN2220_c0_g1_i4.p1 TRINITY_DN2220_c0_g1~~TRINITY_DN2220_c0_g1_i4.p1  ORF type:complete len:124 (-),score=36.73 TRINITY_DN2220_c0_g1_i4:78-449(-)
MLTCRTRLSSFASFVFYCLFVLFFLLTFSFLQKTSTPPITFKEAFYLATVGGGQLVGLGTKLGNFQPGKWFDALVIDPYAPDSAFDVFEKDKLLDVFEKFLLIGDDRNIQSVFVQGKDITIKQ